MTRAASSACCVAAVVCLVAAPLVLSPFSITLMNYIGIYSLVALGLALLTGVGGIVSFGQAAFVGIAAYATAWVSALNGYSPWLGLLFGVALTCCVAAILGVVTLAAAGPFPVALHGRLGSRDRLPVRQCRGARPLQRHLVDPADLASARSRWSTARRSIS